MLFNVDDLAYQIQFPLSIVEGRSEGLLDEGGMGTAINVAIKRGNVVDVVDDAKGQPVLAYEHYHVREGKEVPIFQWSLYTAHTGGGMAALDLGEHFDMEVLLDIEILGQLRKAGKNQLMKNREWDRKIFFCIG
jgi:hypothetical protein